MAASFITATSKPFLSCSKSCSRRRGSMLVAHCSFNVNHQQSFSIQQKTLQNSSMDNQYFNYDDNLEMARSMLSKMKEPSSAMATIDLFQHLGIDYHFSEEIKTILCSLYDNFSIYNIFGNDWKNSLHDVALSFRLLRQDGTYVSPDVFSGFLDKEGNFKVSLCQDMRGMLSLYEASHVDMGEDIMSKANEFSTKHLKASMNHLGLDAREKIEHSLEQPIHKSLQRYNIRRYIQQYKGDFGMNKVLKELAMMDFIKMKSLYTSEYFEVLRWWKQSDLSKQPQSFRNQPLKWFMWSLTLLPEPPFSKQRLEVTKLIALIYLIDDVFDVLGSLEELVLFTEIVERWDNSSIDSLPTYMKICYNALYNTTNEIANLIMMEHGWNPIDSLRKSWASLFKAFLMEARWFTNGFIPKANEYLENGVISTGVHMLLNHLYFLLGNRGSKETIAPRNDDFPQLFTEVAMILRLWDDLGSAEDENQDGFDGSYVDYYMKEHGVSLESARKHTNQMIYDGWKRLNKEFLSPSQFPLSLKKATLNMTRMIRVMYSYNNQKLPMLEEYIRSMLSESN